MCVCIPLTSFCSEALHVSSHFYTASVRWNWNGQTAKTSQSVKNILIRDISCNGLCSLLVLLVLMKNAHSAIQFAWSSSPRVTCKFMATTDHVDNLFVVCLSVTKRGIFYCLVTRVNIHNASHGRRTSTYFPQSLREDNHDPGHEHFCLQIKTINNDGVWFRKES